MSTTAVIHPSPALGDDELEPLDTIRDGLVQRAARGARHPGRGHGCGCSENGQPGVVSTVWRRQVTGDWSRAATRPEGDTDRDRIVRWVTAVTCPGTSGMLVFPLGRRYPCCGPMNPTNVQVSVSRALDRRAVQDALPARRLFDQRRQVSDDLWRSLRDAQPESRKVDACLQ